MMEKYGKGGETGHVHEEARDEVQTAREERYSQRVRVAVDYYIINNIQLRQPGVSYRYVASSLG